MAAAALPFLLLVLFAVTLLQAGFISDDDNELETPSPTTVVSDESSESPSEYFLDDIGFRRKRSAGGVNKVKTPSTQNTGTREDNSRKTGASPSVPQAVYNEKNKKLSNIPENSRAVRAAQDQGARGATLLTSNKSAPAPAGTDSKSKVSSPAADTNNNGSVSGQKPASPL